MHIDTARRSAGDAVVEKAIARLCPAVRYLTVPTGGSNKGLLALTACAALEELTLLSKDGVAPRLAKVMPGRSAPLPHPRRDWARPCHICAGTGLRRAPVILPGAGRSAARRLAP